MRTFEDKVRHDSLVKMMAQYFSSLGYTAVKADIEGYSTPLEIYWINKPQERRIPDMTCNKNDPKNTLIILEAETCESLTIEHTKEQWKLFASHAKNNNGEFHVVVPNQCTYQSNLVTGEFLAKKVASEIGIVIDHIWWPKS
jgi:hypothetical protein